ncbi:MAG: hypothetical protein B7X41_21490 [Microbacterium sp. 14-71-5]|jgi:hypothetical protein|uniref:hypothetical protein n=1 Tax=Microbacterium sp. 13-71-7 TaxID=1970399 RepID=UPI000BCF243D|nr:hypothetical protein [Microbacterium sp. 13-71-7]OZB76860.1 MAG: hypothetical protein B7X41_21490 [Microbacterium sp. 14-71-5]OZB80628.1 MAG: hypothetical protein B7X32_18945 [Microbacterium sp. 13-71-7]
MRAKVIAVLAVLGLAAALAGCAPSGGVRYRTAIPAALKASDPGITEAWADQGLDGFTHYLSVGVTVDREKVTPKELGSMFAVILENNDLGVEQLQLAVTDPSGSNIDIETVAKQLDPAVKVVSDYSTLVISFGDAAHLRDLAAGRTN